MTLKTVGPTLGVVATAVGLWLTLNPWPSVGWTTPNRHAADFSEALGEMREFRDEWKCDEYDEELRDMLAEQAAGDTSTDLAEDITRIRDKMRKLECDRFDDFG